MQKKRAGVKTLKMEPEETVYSHCRFYLNLMTGIMQDKEIGFMIMTLRLEFLAKRFVRNIQKLNFIIFSI